MITSLLRPPFVHNIRFLDTINDPQGLLAPICLQSLVDKDFGYNLHSNRIVFLLPRDDLPYVKAHHIVLHVRPVLDPFKVKVIEGLHFLRF